MKPLLLAAAVLLLSPVAAQAQVAAGSVPNTFDDPGARAQAVPAPAAPTTAALASSSDLVLAAANTYTISFRAKKPC